MSFTLHIGRFQHLGLPKEVTANLVRQINSWLDSSGIEWTVSRLKEIKTWYIHFIGGQEYTPTSWIKSKGGVPAGAFGTLFRMRVSNKVFNALLSYTGMMSDQVTEKQLNKFLSSVEQEHNLPLPHIPNMKNIALEMKSILPTRRVLSTQDYNFGVKYAPDKLMKSQVESLDLLQDDIRCQVIQRILTDYDMRLHFQKALGRFYIPLIEKRTQLFLDDELETGDDKYDGCVGKISCIQEPGLKARFIANPRRIFQVSLLSLGKQLFTLLSRLPWDHTYDHGTSLSKIQKWMKEGKTIHSVDLSDATNNFPLDLQLRYLRWLGIEEADLKLFTLISRSPWFLPKRLDPTHCKEPFPGTMTDGRSIKWTRGQPLGLYPSFAAFAVTHGALVRSIELSLNVSDTFVILGDDIVISNDAVAQEYRKFMNLLHCPISEHKSITSNSVAEFAGKVVTPRYILSGNKWRVPTRNNKHTLLSSLPRKLHVHNHDEFIGLVHRLSSVADCENPEGLSLNQRSALIAPWFMECLSEDLNQVERHSEMREYYQSFLHETVDPRPWTRDQLEKVYGGMLSMYRNMHTLPGTKVFNTSHLQSFALSDNDRQVMSPKEISNRINILFGFPESFIPEMSLRDLLSSDGRCKISSTIMSMNTRSYDSIYQKRALQYARLTSEKQDQVLTMASIYLLTGTEGHQTSKKEIQTILQG